MSEARVCAPGHETPQSTKDAPNFVELRKGEVRRNLIPRIPVNSDKKGRTSVARQGVDATMLSRRTDGPERGVMGVNRNANGPIRVLLADDHTMFREGLAGILASYAGME